MKLKATLDKKESRPEYYWGWSSRPELRHHRVFRCGIRAAYWSGADEFRRVILEFIQEQLHADKT